MAYTPIVNLINIFIAIHKHDLPATLSDGTYKLLMILLDRANLLQFPDSFTVYPKHLMRLGAAKDRNQVHSRREVLTKLVFDGQPFLTGSSPKYVFNWEALVAINGLISPEKYSEKQAKKTQRLPNVYPTVKRQPESGSTGDTGAETQREPHLYISDKNKNIQSAHTRAHVRASNGDLDPNVIYNYEQTLDWGILQTARDLDRAHQRFQHLLEGAGIKTNIQHTDSQPAFDRLVAIHGEETLLGWLKDKKTGSKLGEYLETKNNTMGI